MNVLVVCEESQTVCIEFRKRGHFAFSCDLQSCSGGHPEWHIKGDCLKVINGRKSWIDLLFVTQNGDFYFMPEKWDLIIAFPPCTYLTKAGAVRLYSKGVLNEERYLKGLAAVEFFNTILNANCDKICIENPQPMKIFNLPGCSQIIQPYMFGHNYTKKTLLWLKNLPILFSTCLCVPEYSFTDVHSTPKQRSKFHQGIAQAMAEQWG